MATEKDRYKLPLMGRRATRSLLRSRHRNVAGAWKIEKGCQHLLSEPVVYLPDVPPAQRPATKPLPPNRRHERSPQRLARRQQSRASHSTSLEARAKITRTT